MVAVEPPLIITTLCQLPFDKVGDNVVYIILLFFSLKNCTVVLVICITHPSSVDWFLVLSIVWPPVLDVFNHIEKVLTPVPTTPAEEPASI